MSSLLDNHWAGKGSRAAHGDPPGSLHQGGIQLSSWRRTLGMLYLRAREASRGSSGSAEGPEVGGAVRLGWAERRVRPLLRLPPPPCGTRRCPASTRSTARGVLLALKHHLPLAPQGFGAAGKFLHCLAPVITMKN